MAHMVNLAHALSRWSRRNALRPIVFGTACCADELAAALGPRFDDGRSGLLPPSETPGPADVLIVAGRVSLDAIPALRQIYGAMAPPRWVMAFGSCAASGGMFDTYAAAGGVASALPPDVPVDVHVPGCPPRPEDLCDALEALRQRMGRAAQG